MHPTSNYKICTQKYTISVKYPINDINIPNLANFLIL